MPQLHRHVLAHQPEATSGCSTGEPAEPIRSISSMGMCSKPSNPTHSPAWRQLDVAIVQRYLLDQVLKPNFTAGVEPGRGYTATARKLPP